MRAARNPTRILIVDWLGRGGIAQMTIEWLRTLKDAGEEVMVVTRRGREIVESDEARLVGNRYPRLGGIGYHRSVVDEARTAIQAWGPDVVVVQNSIIPLLERPLLVAARRAGATCVFVAHNARPHERRSGFSIGLSGLLTSADLVIAHSRFVADQLPRTSATVVLPLPVPSLVTAAVPEDEWPDRVTPPVLLQFGVLNRGYKGAALLKDLAEQHAGAWHFRLAGTGAADRQGALERLSIRDGYLDAADLLREIRRSTAVALPYRSASQSAVVTLAQGLGRVPLATAVGGIPEQISHGVDGFLVPPVAGRGEWASVLQHWDLERAVEMGDAARRRAVSSDAAFRAGVLEVVSG